MDERWTAKEKNIEHFFFSRAPTATPPATHLAQRARGLSYQVHQVGGPARVGRHVQAGQRERRGRQGCCQGRLRVGHGGRGGGLVSDSEALRGGQTCCCWRCRGRPGWLAGWWRWRGGRGRRFDNGRLWWRRGAGHGRAHKRGRGRSNRWQSPRPRPAPHTVHTSGTPPPTATPTGGLPHQGSGLAPRAGIPEHRPPAQQQVAQGGAHLAAGADGGVGWGGQGRGEGAAGAALRVRAVGRHAVPAGRERRRRRLGVVVVVQHRSAFRAFALGQAHRRRQAHGWACKRTRRVQERCTAVAAPARDGWGGPAGQEVGGERGERRAGRCHQNNEGEREGEGVCVSFPLFRRQARHPTHPPTHPSVCTHCLPSPFPVECQWPAPYEERDRRPNSLALPFFNGPRQD